MVKTNKFYAENNVSFIYACKEAGISTTARQASKFKRGFGLAYKVLVKQVKVIKTAEGNFVKILKQ